MTQTFWVSMLNSVAFSAGRNHALQVYSVAGIAQTTPVLAAPLIHIVKLPLLVLEFRENLLKFQQASKQLQEISAVLQQLQQFVAALHVDALEAVRDQPGSFSPSTLQTFTACFQTVQELTRLAHQLLSVTRRNEACHKELQAQLTQAAPALQFIRRTLHTELHPGRLTDNFAKLIKAVEDLHADIHIRTSDPFWEGFEGWDHQESEPPRGTSSTYAVYCRLQPPGKMVHLKTIQIYIC